MISAILLVILTILRKCLTHVLHMASRARVLTTHLSTVPPVGVYCVAGCGADLLINICLTILGYVFSLFLPPAPRGRSLPSHVPHMTLVGFRHSFFFFFSFFCIRATQKDY